MKEIIKTEYEGVEEEVYEHIHLSQMIIFLCIDMDMVTDTWVNINTQADMWWYILTQPSMYKYWYEDNP